MSVSSAAAWRRRAVVLLAAPLLTVAWASPAAAATLSQTPRTSWTAWKACPNGSAQNCAQVRATLKIPGTTKVVLAGNFTHMRSPRGVREAVDSLAVIDDRTGGLVRTFRKHAFNGTIYSLESNGRYVYAAGSFTTVDGHASERLVRFNAATGAVSGMRTQVNGAVYGTELSNGKLYIGGNFSRVQGNYRRNLAALDADTGVVDAGWTPSAAKAPVEGTKNNRAHNKIPVRDVEANGNGTRIYIAGDFDVVNGVANRSTVVALGPRAGNFASYWTQRADFDASKGFQGMELAVVDRRPGMAPGVILASGGQTNRAWRLATSGRVVWRALGDGDFQAAAVIGDRVYLGGHFVCISTRSCFDGNKDGDVQRVSIAAFPYDGRGHAVPVADWAPALGPLNRAKTGLRAPYYFGVWDLHTSGGGLYVGGVFGNVTAGGRTYRQPKFVRFAPR